MRTIKSTISALCQNNLPSLRLGFLTAVNCYKVKTVKAVQDFFSVLKILALITIIVIGFVWLSYGHVENMGHPMRNTSYR